MQNDAQYTLPDPTPWKQKFLWSYCDQIEDLI